MPSRAGGLPPSAGRRAAVGKTKAPKPAATASTPQHRMLALQGAAGNAAVARVLAVQRDITVETDQMLPRAVVERDPQNAQRLVIHYGAAVVANLEVTGGNVDAVQVRDRTGARNQGQKIEAIDLDVVHGPGVTVTLTPLSGGLATTRKSLGVGEVKLTQVERKPPYGIDELQLWPPAAALGPQRQRRELTPGEHKADEQRRDEERVRDADDARQVAVLRKEYDRLSAATDIADRYLMNLYGIGLIFQAMTQLPDPTLYNDIRKQLFEAGQALDYRSPGRARVLLKRADAALWKANGEVSAAVKTGIENTDTAIELTRKISIVSTVVGKTLARMIPGPIGKILTILSEVLEPAPQNMEQLSERLMGAAQTGQAWAQEAPPAGSKTLPKGSGNGTVPDETVPAETVPGGTPTVRDPSKRGTTTVPDESPVGGGGGGGGGRSPGTPTGRSDQKTVKGGASAQQQSPATAPKVTGPSEQFVASSTARIADRPAPSLEDFSGFQLVRRIGGPGAGAGGINVKYILRDPAGRTWMFKPASLEEGMGYGPALGIETGQRYRRAAAAAFMADQLGVDTPQTRLGTWNGGAGSLQEWRAGYQTGTQVEANNAQKFQTFWDSQQRKDLDALDYVIAHQDRHTGNVMLKDRPGGGTDVLAIDQDAAFPPSSARFDPNDYASHPRINYQRPLADTISNSMAQRMRDLNANWPETTLRQWLTQAEVAGARARLTEIITKLDNGQLTVVRR